jgi:3-oxoacyl-[acyl-carrier-protein] synthase-3
MSTAHRKHPSGIGIIGIGAHVPEGTLTNLDLEQMVDTSDEWILERTGIRKRHKADSKTATSDLAVRAALRALEDAGMVAADIDVIILGSGFLYGLSIAEDFVKAEKYKRVLVIGAETLTKIVDWTDRSTCVLFGDGAGAAVVGRIGEGRGIISSLLASDGTMGELLKLPAGGSRMPPTAETIKAGLHYVKMEGNKLFKAAVKAMASAATEVLEDAGYTGDDLDLLVTHQANMRIIDATARRIDVPKEKVFSNVDMYGNTSAASIPIALTEARDKGILKEGMLVELVSFGGGLTWASVLLRW